MKNKGKDHICNGNDFSGSAALERNNKNYLDRWPKQAFRAHTHTQRHIYIVPRNNTHYTRPGAIMGYLQQRSRLDKAGPVSATSSKYWGGVPMPTWSNSFKHWPRSWWHGMAWHGGTVIMRVITVWWSWPWLDRDHGAKWNIFRDVPTADPIDPSPIFTEPSQRKTNHGSPRRCKLPQSTAAKRWVWQPRWSKHIQLIPTYNLSPLDCVFVSYNKYIYIYVYIMFKKMIEIDREWNLETSVSRCTSETPTLASTTLDADGCGVHCVHQIVCVSFCNDWHCSGTCIPRRWLVLTKSHKHAVQRVLLCPDVTCTAIWLRAAFKRKQRRILAVLNCA